VTFVEALPLFLYCNLKWVWTDLIPVAVTNPRPRSQRPMRSDPEKTPPAETASQPPAPQRAPKTNLRHDSSEVDEVDRVDEVDGADHSGLSTGSTRSTSPSSSPAGTFRPDEIGEIPRAPGVYTMFDSRRKVLYVGKAVNLRARVRQYFAGPSGDTRLCVPLILKSLDHIETIVTGNEKEAFLLENTLIKRHRPRYNVRLRDDKTYVSVRIDPTEKWPRAIVTRERRRDKALYFGPYSNVQAIRKTLSLLQRVFPIRSCTDAVFRNRTRPCILHPIGRCTAPCVGLIGEEEYGELVRNTILFLKGRTTDLAENLHRKMQEHSEKMEYEKAAALRDRVKALEASLETQRVERHAAGDRDAIATIRTRGVRRWC